MTKKFIWLIISCLMVAALILASCAPAVVEEKEAKVVTKEPEKKVEEVVEKPVGEPQRGGKLTMLMRSSNDDPPSPDIMDGYHSPTQWLAPILERPIIGDFEKYGPRGTGEYDFQLRDYIPESFLKGNLFESWEMAPDKLVIQIRPGIYWQGRDVMESREFTAEDMVADLIYFKAAPAGGDLRELALDIYTTGKYSLVIETPYYDASFLYYIGWEDRTGVSPPETEGSDKWEDVVGTGPFMLKEYVVGSHMKFEKNPSYWATTTINGKEYQLPFIDELMWPIIPDVSTQIAALRTGKLDFVHIVDAVHWPTLDKTAPELLSNRSPWGSGNAIVLKTTEPPTDNIDVRRALMAGTDLKVFADLQGAGPLPKHWFPQWPGNPDVFTPLEELPAETRLLFDYNPDLAKQMLADAGYPDGLKIQLYVPSNAKALDRAALTKDMWAKIGVEVEIKATESVTFSELLHKGTYNHAIMSTGAAVASPLEGLRYGTTGAIFNWSLWSNERYDELARKALAEFDYAERSRLIKEAAVMFINDLHWIPTDLNVVGHFWWPWLKNYYGERNVGDMEIITILARAWIDQDLKKEMGH